MNTGAERLQQLREAIEQIEYDQVFEYLSRWSLGQMLDRVATKIKECLEGAEVGRLECTLLYRVSDVSAGAIHKPRYIIGGSSVLRTTMDPISRRYVLDANAHKCSFTAYSLRNGQPLAFNDFAESIQAPGRPD